MVNISSAAIAPVAVNPNGSGIGGYRSFVNWLDRLVGHIILA
jgi:hypothetical protein